MRLLLGVLAAFLLALPASAQEPTGPEYVGAVPTNSVNHYYFAQPAELTKRISVWGTVRSPGTYFVRRTVDLEGILSLAGGPSLSPRQEDVDRVVTIRVYRLENDQRILAYEETLVDMIAEPGAYPELLEGDVVEVETVEDRQWTFRDTVTVVGAVATTIVAIERLVNLASGR
ncbi:MAG: hypothetical protein AAF791_12095 [Bacteroidota bacterium]